MKYQTNMKYETQYVIEEGTEILMNINPSIVRDNINLFIKSFWQYYRAMIRNIYFSGQYIEYTDLEYVVLYRKILFHGNICNIELRQCYIC